MPDSEPRVLTDDAVPTAVLSLIREAREYVVLVTPYSRFWEHLKNEIHLALQRKVRITAICRESALSPGPTRQDMHWLCREGAMVYAVSNLHAKLYLNESSVLLTSMNLLDSSSKNSMEVGIRVDGDDARALRQYAKRMTDLGHRVAPERLRSPAMPRASGPREGSVVSRIGKMVRGVVTRGRCIRCNAFIPFDVASPLCDVHFAEWNRFKNHHYAERYCHGCGRERETTHARPLCTPCWQKSSRPRLPFGMGFADGKESEEQPPREQHPPTPPR